MSAARRKSRKGPLTLRSFLESKRVSELQEFHTFWAEDTKAPGRKAELVDALQSLIRDPSQVGARVKLLAEQPRLVLHLLVRHDDYSLDLAGLVRASDGARVEGYELEAAARALGRRGFVEVAREQNGRPVRREVYSLPRELAETISLLLMEDRRNARQVFTLEGHLESLDAAAVARLLRHHGLDESTSALQPDEAAAVLLGTRDTDALFDSAPDDDVRTLLLRVALQCGGVVARGRFKSELGMPLRWQRKRWKRYLEEEGLGTVTTLGLSDFGIELEGATTVLFGEVVERVFATTPHDESTHHRVAEARVDLLTDLALFLRHVHTSPVRMTHGRTIHRAAHGRIVEGLTFREQSVVDREEVFDVVFSAATGLELIETGEDRVLRLTRRGRRWENVPLANKVRRLWEHLLQERRPDEDDFHERALRGLLARRLSGLAPGRWVRLYDFPFLARNEYLATLEESGVRSAYRNRYRRSFSPPTQDPHTLAEDLVRWTCHRLFLLGVVDLAMGRDEPLALRLTEQGHRLLRGERRSLPSADDEASGDLTESTRSRPLVVNPDFEVLLLPEGDINEMAHTLDRFARRVRSDAVSRFRLEREGIERAIVQGMTVDSILEFLAGRSRTPVPQNVTFSIREWGGRVRFARQRTVTLLEVDREDALDRALELEGVKALLLDRIGPRAAALRSPVKDFKTLESLRALGVYLR